MLIVTTEYVSGKETEMLGLVKGSTIQTVNAFKDIGAGLKTLIGGELTKYNEMMDKASHPDTYINEDGEEESLGTMTYGFGNQVYEIGAPTEDDVKAMTELIENASGEICYDTFVYGIIEEEIGAVFEGNKTAEDAAAIIQSRIQTYVDESR